MRYKKVEPNTSYRLAIAVARLGNAKDLTAKALADKSDLSPSTVYSLMNAGVKAYNPKLSTLTKLAKALGTPLSSLLETRKSVSASQ